MENPYEVEMKQKRKILIATIAMTAIILALLVWVIVATIAGSNGDTAEQNTDDTQPIVATQEVIPGEAAGTVSDVDSTTSGATADSATSSTSGDIPTTGPADTAFTALLAGVATYLAFRFVDSRRALATLPANK